MATADPDSRQSTSGAPDSNWWYVVAAVPLFVVLASVVGFLVAIVAFVATLAGAGSPTPGAAVGLGFVGLFGLLVVFALVGLLLSLAFPVAIYLDAEAVADAGGGWQPDPALYGLLGLVGVVAQPVQLALGVYYLYKRHESVGVP